MVRISSVAVEVLVGLIHKGANRRFASWLEAVVIGGIQIRNSQFAHKRFNHGGCDGTRHACKWIHIHYTIKSLFGVLPYAGNAQAGFGSHTEGEKIIFF